MTDEEREKNGQHKIEYYMPEFRHMDEQRLDKLVMSGGLVKPPLDYRLDEIEQNICVLCNALNEVINRINQIGHACETKGIL